VLQWVVLTSSSKLFRYPLLFFPSLPPSPLPVSVMSCPSHGIASLCPLSLQMQSQQGRILTPAEHAHLVVAYCRYGSIEKAVERLVIAEVQSSTLHPSLFSLLHSPLSHMLCCGVPLLLFLFFPHCSVLFALDFSLLFPLTSLSPLSSLSPSLSLSLPSLGLWS
jgi:hypothetical protein